MTIPASTC